MRVLWTIMAFLIAVLVGTLLATAASSYYVLVGLEQLGVEIPPDERTAMITHDLMGMGPLYGPVIGIGLLIAFLIAGLIARFMPAVRSTGFVLAGAVAMAAILYFTGQIFDTVIIAGARSQAGYVAQLASGAIAGLVFALLKRPQPPKVKPEAGEPDTPSDIQES